MKKADPRPDAATFEQALARLEEIVQKLEKGDLPLEDSLGLYEEGIRLSKLCHGKLEEAEGRIELLLKDSRGEVLVDAAGKPKTKPLAPPAEDGDVPF
jgi:exodeoxyribonuclease VII small subunit